MTRARILADFGAVTSTAAELNALDGITSDVTDLNYAKTLYDTGVTAAEFDYMDGVTSNVQTQFTAKAPKASPAFTGTPTGITAAHITSGVLPVGVTGGSGLDAVSAGITHASQWRLHTGWTGVADPIASDKLEAVDTDGFGVLGAAMTNSSGVWTFPTEGIWKIEAQISAYLNGDSRTTSITISTSLNNGGAWGNASTGQMFFQSTSSLTSYNSTSTSFIFDVTNVSNDKCKFVVGCVGSPIIDASTEQSYSFFNFIRLGDT